MVAEREKKASNPTNTSRTAKEKSAAGNTDQSNAAPPFIDATQPPNAATAKMVKMTVNGRLHSFQVEPNWPLRDVLRQKLGLISIKDFCSGYGACGSCTVIMDGRPILSCMTLAVECEGAVIETAEGIADAKHPLVEQYIMHWTAQCGYCTPGFLVTAKALLDHNNDPTEEQIKEALAGNLCRCGSYPVHIKAIQDAAKMLRKES